jgi:hypothetical protein
VVAVVAVAGPAARVSGSAKTGIASFPDCSDVYHVAMSREDFHIDIGRVSRHHVRVRCSGLFSVGA